MIDSLADFLLMLSAVMVGVTFITFLITKRFVRLHESQTSEFATLYIRLAQLDHEVQKLQYTDPMSFRRPPFLVRPEDASYINTISPGLLGGLGPVVVSSHIANEVTPDKNKPYEIGTHGWKETEQETTSPTETVALSEEGTLF